MFSMFPDGWPGAGLLLLRAACGAVLIIQAVAYFVHGRELIFQLGVGSAMSAVGLLLMIGLMTRYVALLATVVGVGSVFSWFPGSGGGPLVTPMTAGLFAAIAAALALLGPGALSFDSRIFGRREIIIPPSHRSNSA
jgi:hypothetical protein